MTNDEQFQFAKHLWATREKFDLFVVGLTFTVLGAAVQTAKFETSNAAQWFELLAWSLLLTSGLLGILRIYLLTTALTFDRLMDEVDSLEEELRTIRGEIDSLNQHPSGSIELKKQNTLHSERVTKARGRIQGQRTAFYSSYGALSRPRI